MPKSPDAFRTISEVADWLDVPTHVLRFWESRFTQVKPVKRAGGRRYYRPADMELLGGIKRLLHDEGLTIRGVQKLLREDGVSHVAALSPPLDAELSDAKGKVITLTPKRDDSWAVPEDPVQAVDALADQIEAEAETEPDLQLRPEPAENIAVAEPKAPTTLSPRDPEPLAQNAMDEQNEPAAPEETVAEVADTDSPTEPVSAGAALPDTSVDVPLPEPLDAKAGGPSKPKPLADIPMPDIDALSEQPLCIAPLVAKGRASRQREAETFAPIAARAKALLRDLNVRM